MKKLLLSLVALLSATTSFAWDLINGTIVTIYNNAVQTNTYVKDLGEDVSDLLSVGELDASCYWIVWLNTEDTYYLQNWKTGRFIHATPQVTGVDGEESDIKLDYSSAVYAMECVEGNNIYGFTSLEDPDGNVRDNIYFTSGCTGWNLRQDATTKQEINVHSFNAVYPDNKRSFWVVDVYSSTYTVISDGGWGTFVAPFNIEYLPEAIEAYTVAVNGNSVVLTKVDRISQDQAVVLKASPDSYKLFFSNSVEPLTGNELQPVISDGDVVGTGSEFVLDVRDGLVGFYKVADGVALESGKGYLKLSGDAAKNDFLPIEGVTDGVQLPAAQAAKGTIYNLQGQSLGAPAKGINIIDGKKMVVK